MWFIGGYLAGGAASDEVWTSTDGITWTEVIAVGDKWDARSAQCTVVYDNKIWVIAGYTDEGVDNQVWYSENGINWTQLTSEGDRFGNLYDHSCAVVDDTILVIGGFVSIDEVWSLDILN